MILSAGRLSKTMETKILRRTSGIIHHYRIRNNDFRDRYGVTPIMETLRNGRLRWYGPVIRANEN